MTAEQRKTIRAWALAVGGPLLVLAIAGWARSAVASKLDTSRFVADSIRREILEGQGQREREAQRVILERLDSRVGAMFCGGLPAERQAGCR